MTTLSANTQAILLLTAPLLVDRHADRRSGAEPPLTGKEYNRLALELRNLQRQPADLLGQDAEEALRACRAIVDEVRARRLLERGLLLSRAVERWSNRAIWVLSRADAAYPRRLKSRLKDLAPPVLYGCGDQELLGAGGLAVVGSRNVDDALVAYAEDIGRRVAEARHAVVSGGARGIDQAAMRGALESRGVAVGVLADSLEKATMSRDNRNMLLDRRLALVSPYDPIAGFNVGNAMQRNKLIYALADAALVVNSDVDKGGTWAGATEQLEKLRSVRVYVRSTGDVGAGLQALQLKGAVPWPNPSSADELSALLALPFETPDAARQNELPLAASTASAEPATTPPAIEHPTATPPATEQPAVAQPAPERATAASTASPDPSLQSEIAQVVERLARLLRRLPDDSFDGFLDETLIAPLLRALQDPHGPGAHAGLAELLPEGKHRLAFVERLRRAMAAGR
jgi:DNA processing protein